MIKEILKESVFEGLTDAECVAKLDESTELNRDETSYLWGGLNIKLLENGVDPSLVATWDQLIANLPGGPMLGEMLRSGGVNLSLDSVRGPIQSAIGTTTESVDSLLNALLDIGIETGKRYAYYGLSELPTEAEVATARAETQNESEVASLLNEVIHPKVAEGATLAEIKTAVAAWGE